MNIPQWTRDYLEQSRQALADLDEGAIARATELLREANREDRQIFAIGNGGSASTGSHFVTDLGKGSSDAIAKRFRCLCLSDCNSWLTAIGNDYSYEDIFRRQLKNFAREGDLLLCISVSGTSPNLIAAARWAQEHGVRIIALLGSLPTELEEMAEVCIRVNSTHYGVVEEAHLSICHAFCYAFMEIPELKD